MKRLFVKGQEAHNKNFVGDMSGTFWYHILSHAKDRKIEVNITHNEAWNLFIIQNKKCSLTGMEIFFGKRINRSKMEKSSASLDRIESDKPYSFANCQWIYSKLNAMKRNLPNDRFIYLCRLVENPILDKTTYIIQNFNTKKSRSKYVGDISGTIWTQIQYAANSRYIKFNVDQQYIWDIFLEQNGKCIYTGLPLVFYKNYKDLNKTASLDRIDNSKGYIDGNLQWVHKDINFMKRDLLEVDFIDLCKSVACYNKEINYAA